MRKGLFITFEGGEACGKSTQIQLLKEYIDKRQDKKNFIFIREPGGTKLGEEIRELLLNFETDSPTPKAELLLFLASRAQIFEKIILPSLNEGKVVIADRFFDSTVAYQGFARNILSAEEIYDLHKTILGNFLPDITFYLKISPSEAFKRKAVFPALDRMEKEGKDFHQKVYEGYNYLSEKEPDRFEVIDATQSIEKIHQQIVTVINKNLTKKDV